MPSGGVRPPRRGAAAIAAGCLAGGVFGADLYVSPTGSPDGAGTRERPWDLASTLEGRRAVGPGDTIYLLGGTYRRRPDAEFAVRLRGEPGRPIHVRPAPRERATIEGGPAIEEPSAHVWLWDLEVLVSENFTLSREIEEPGSNPSAYGRPWGGVHLRGGRSAKLIHLTIHDCAQGVSAWSSAIDTEIYGCRIYEKRPEGRLRTAEIGKSRAGACPRGWSTGQSLMGVRRVEGFQHGFWDAGKSAGTRPVDRLRRRRRAVGRLRALPGLRA